VCRVLYTIGEAGGHWGRQWGDRNICAQVPYGCSTGSITLPCGPSLAAPPARGVKFSNVTPSQPRMIVYCAVRLCGILVSLDTGVSPQPHRYHCARRRRVSLACWPLAPCRAKALALRGCLSISARRETGLGRRRSPPGWRAFPSNRQRTPTRRCRTHRRTSQSAAQPVVQSPPSTAAASGQAVATQQATDTVSTDRVSTDTISTDIVATDTAAPRAQLTPKRRWPWLTCVGPCPLWRCCCAARRRRPRAACCSQRGAETSAADEPRRRSRQRRRRRRRHLPPPRPACAPPWSTPCSTS
jgi:hypothetical protein